VGMVLKLGFKAEDLPYPFFLCLILPIFKFLILSLNDHLSHPFPYLGFPLSHALPQNCDVGLVLGLKLRAIGSVFRVLKKWKTFCKRGGILKNSPQRNSGFMRELVVRGWFFDQFLDFLTTLASSFKPKPD